MIRRVRLRRSHMRPKSPKARVSDRYRQGVKAAIWAERPCCQLCGGSRFAECLAPDQMHEDPSRAKTRGLPKEERFNDRVCGRLCDACHRDVTEHRLFVVFADAVQRFAGRVWATTDKAA